MKKTLILIFLFITAFSRAQQYKFLAGDLKNIPGIKSYQIQFDYVGTKVNDVDPDERLSKKSLQKSRHHDLYRNR